MNALRALQICLICVLVQTPPAATQTRGSVAVAMSPSLRPGLLNIGTDDKVILCHDEGVKCQTIDPCGSCGHGRCSNLDHSCLGAGVLKSGYSCDLRWASVPTGVQVDVCLGAKACAHERVNEQKCEYARSYARNGVGA